LTFAEILVSIVILGICVTFLLGGTASLPVAATVHRQDAQADLILRNWAEAIKAKGLTTTGLCAADESNPYAFSQLGNYLPTPTDGLSDVGFTVSPPVVTTWDGVAPVAFAGCDPSTAKLAKVGLTVASSGNVHAVAQTLEVVVAAT
jgi:hypothetical protein